MNRINTRLYHLSANLSHVPEYSYRTRDTEVEREHGPFKGKTEPTVYLKNFTFRAAAPRVLNLNPANPVGRRLVVLLLNYVFVMQTNNPLKQLNVTDRIQTCCGVFPLLMFQASTYANYGNGSLNTNKPITAIASRETEPHA
jgi:hypothetical protein